MPDRRIRLRGAAGKLFTLQASEVLIAGPAGTGKSLACLLRLYSDAMNIPRLRCLILRKTRASLTESALVTFERDVLGDAQATMGRASRAMRRQYPLANGSTIVVGGLDQSSRIMSTDFDRVYIQEAIEFTEPEWETITTRLGRQGQLGMLMADTNPDRPTHWLKRRCDAGATLLLESRHEDNPVLWDGQAWTPAGASYLARLDRLSGPRRMRLRFGRWVQSEGVVYEGWDAAIHVIDRFLIPRDWTRYLAVDFGFTHPFVCQWWARDNDGRLYLYREIYRTHRLVEDHCRDILAQSQADPRPAAIICDHDAEDRATMEKHLKLPTRPAWKEKSPGIQAVAARLRVLADRRPRLYVLRDSVVKRDPSLEEAKKPMSTAEEFDSYIWETGGTARTKGEEPVKEDDHGMDAARYMVAYLDVESNRIGWGKPSPARSILDTLPAGARGPSRSMW